PCVGRRADGFSGLSIPGGVFDRLMGRSPLSRGFEELIQSAFADPRPDHLAWLLAVIPDHDPDHAMWELRYLRASLLVYAAATAPLDDGTAAQVALEVESLLRRDSRVDRAKRDVALSQYRLRCAGY